MTSLVVLPDTLLFVIPAQAEIHPARITVGGLRGRYRQTVDPGSSPGMTSLVVLPDTLLFVIPAQAGIHPARITVGGLRGRYR